MIAVFPVMTWLDIVNIIFFIRVNFQYIQTCIDVIDDAFGNNDNNLWQ